MSFVFRGSRGDIESGFPSFIPERRVVRMHGGGRSINANPMAILATILLLFMILNSHQMSPNFLLWLGLGVFFMTRSLRMYAMCQQLQAQAQAHAAAIAAAAGGLVSHTELRLRFWIFQRTEVTFEAYGKQRKLIQRTLKAVEKAGKNN